MRMYIFVIVSRDYDDYYKKTLVFSQAEGSFEEVRQMIQSNLESYEHIIQAFEVENIIQAESNV